ncbi:methylmalonyl-CoA mutase [Alkalicaulis satelles]|uniref:Methylmalonyl-CoA mutase n=1 Tax=Alkalicaulis satelles TaxID=2609175 RepID=A0A5M6ZIM2_9PROT|nr:methylmalonyl-CoA mutase family protein [Alkalicaulis satelles]KAA5804676.1 methylmalonyl-CoA mutase [Alkalicaulis satelles]
MTHSVRPLAEGFAAPSLEDWRALADGALKGAPYESLVRQTLDGLARGPLFTRADLDEACDPGAPGAAPFIRGARPERDAFLPWAIRQRADLADPQDANAAILDDLAGGVSEITLSLDPTGRAGVAVRSYDDLARTLDGVMADLAPVWLAPAFDAPDAGAHFITWLKQQGYQRDGVRGGLGLTLPDGAHVQAALLALGAFPALTPVTIRAHDVYEAGASEGQELAYACAAGAAWMRALIDAGLDADAAAGAIEVTLGADADVHLTIAKLRALRRLWSRILEAFGVSADARALKLHAVTGARMLSARDPYTNLIRNACAGLAAAAGGADSVEVRAFTHAMGASTRFARRLARNLHILLMEESHVGRTADPAGGGYLHETLAERLAQNAWTRFQAIEKDGGAARIIASGAFARDVAEMAAKRAARYARGSDALIGVTAYPELDARKVETGPAPASFGPAPDAPRPWPALEPVRFAAPFEALREAAEPVRPKAFLATIGEAAAYSARASFAANRLAVAGVAAIPAEAHDTPDACLDAFKASGAALAVICGTDAAYGEHAAALAAALKSAGAREVWLAGRPLDISGIDHFIHMRSDALADGARAHAVTGVAS